MECRRCKKSFFHCLALVVWIGLESWSPALAQPATNRNRQRASRRASQQSVVQATHAEDFELETLCDSCGLDLTECTCSAIDCSTGSDSLGCCDAVDCGTPVGCTSLGGWGLIAGFEATILKPRFANNEAYTVMESDGANFDSFHDVEFDYNTEFTPRVWIELETGSNVGWRCTWWQFDHDAALASANPPGNGFGEITLPPFRNIDISSSIPTDTVSATTGLNAYAIDLDAIHTAGFLSWELRVGGGVRYAFVEQSYLAKRRDIDGDLRDEIDYRHSTEGIGPTILLEARRHCTPQYTLFCKARGSALFGTGESRLDAGEDLDLASPFITTAVTSRDDLLSIGEVQAGIAWRGTKYRGQAFRPYLSLALEGQVWNGVGNATSEDGSLGFFGFNIGVGGTF